LVRHRQFLRPDPQCGYGVLNRGKQATIDYATFVTLHSFTGTDGANPFAGLIQAGNGYLYGTTENSGTDYGGTIFKINLNGTLTTLYDFCSQSMCTDGLSPFVPLFQASNGDLYGTTSEGGLSTYDGTLFKITPAGALTTLYSFCSQSGCTNGYYPSNLVQARDGLFYGTTLFNGFESGSFTGYGTIFTMTPSGALTTLYNFCPQGYPCPDGYEPSALVQARDGYLYGTTLLGGVDSSGSIFKITPGGALTTFYTFCSLGSPCTDGGSPSGVIQGSDGNL
jgi:uncharacterized repeat protein (TIGR03803 family)